MTRTFLIHAPHNQSVKTVEGYEGYPIVYSNPVYYETKEILAADFGLVDVGDELVICYNSAFKFMAKVTSIEMLTDASGDKHDGFPVKVIFGKKLGDFSRLSASVACSRLGNEASYPRLLNPNNGGFKQGAFAELLNEEQSTVIKGWIK